MSYEETVLSSLSSFLRAVISSAYLAITSFYSYALAFRFFISVNSGSLSYTKEDYNEIVYFWVIDITFYISS